MRLCFAFLTVNECYGDVSPTIGISGSASVCRWSFLGLSIAGVYSTEMIVKHFAKKLFTFEGVACEMESNGVAEGAGTIKEVIFWLGLYDQLRFAHATIMPQSGSEARNQAVNYGTSEALN